MTSKQLGGMWMRFWFLLSGLWFAFCAYFAATVPESNPDIWSVRVEVFAVGSLGFVLWIVARFIRHGINMEQWQREMRKVHFKRWLERTLRLTLYYYAALTITAILYGITYVVFAYAWKGH